MNKILALVMVLGVLGGVLVGCSGDKGADNNAAPTTPAAGADAKSS